MDTVVTMGQELRESVDCDFQKNSLYCRNGECHNLQVVVEGEKRVVFKMKKTVYLVDLSLMHPGTSSEVAIFSGLGEKTKKVVLHESVCKDMSINKDKRIPFDDF